MNNTYKTSTLCTIPLKVLSILGVLSITALGVVVMPQTSLASANQPHSQSGLSTNTSTVQTIRFDEGRITSQVEGVLVDRQDKGRYQFDAQQGQYALINISGIHDSSKADEVANSGVLIMPSGAIDGNKGGIIYQDCLPETGTYQLTISRNLMATLGGRAGYHVELIVLPSYASRDLCD